MTILNQIFLPLSPWVSFNIDKAVRPTASRGESLQG